MTSCTANRNSGTGTGTGPDEPWHHRLSMMARLVGEPSEKALQRLGYSSKIEQKYGSSLSQAITRCEPSRPEEVNVDLRSLFSGQHFSFLADESEGRQELDERDSGTTTSQTKLNATSVSVRERQRKKRCCFFFHWANPELSNRRDSSFSTSRTWQELERSWPKQRSAMKQLLRQSHRHAVRTARQRKRTNRTATET